MLDDNLKQYYKEVNGKEKLVKRQKTLSSVRLKHNLKKKDKRDNGENLESKCR